MVVFGIFGGKKPTGDINIENVLSELSIREGKIIERDDVTYVKSMALEGEGKNLDDIRRQLQKGNVIILDVKSISYNKLLLRDVVKDIRDICVELNGDLARLSEEKIIVLPGGMKISHSEGGG